jgi:hypothetical protein
MRKWLILSAFAAMLLLGLWAASASFRTPVPGVTRENGARLRRGMKYEEVRAILGAAEVRREPLPGGGLGRGWENPPLDLLIAVWFGASDEAEVAFACTLSGSFHN